MTVIRDFTHAQKRAFEAPNRSIVVSAAAGSGKTSVLIEKYTRLLLEGNAPERILVITFTRKAAAQLRERAMKALSKSGDPNLAKLLPQVAQAPISTIHSFCSSLIREFAPIAGIDPGFGSLEEVEANELLTQAYERTVNRYSQDERRVADYELLQRIFGSGRSDESLRALVFMLHEFLRRLPNPEERTREWLATYEEASTAKDFASTKWGSLYLYALGAELDVWKRKFDKLVDEFDGIAVPAKWREIFGNDIRVIASIFDAFPDLDAMARIADVKWQRSPNKLKDDERANAWKDRFGEFRKQFSVQQSGSFARGWLIPSATLLSDLRRFHESGALEGLMRLTDDFGETYARMKRMTRSLDFADLIVYAYRLIADSKPTDESAGEAEAASRKADVYTALTTRYSHILMDEYQDTNPIQDEIVNMLAQTPNVQVFRVGDIKQSIYRFQHAEPDLIRERYDRSEDSSDAVERRVDLPDNFRSVSPVVDFVNAVFSRLMTEDFGCVNYNAGHALVSRYAEKHQEQGFTDDYPSVSIRLVIDSRDADGAPDETTDDAPPDPEALSGNGDNANADETSGDAGDEARTPAELKSREREAALVAREILRLMHADPPLTILEESGDGDRRVPVSYRHIAILMSAPSSWVETYARVFEAFDIPLRGTGKDALDEEPLARDLLNLLAIIDNPIQDIPLAGALLSPMCGAGPDTLFLIRSAGQGDAPLYDAVQGALELGWDGFAARFGDMFDDEKLRDSVKTGYESISRFVERLETLRAYARAHSIADLVDRAIAVYALDEIAALDARADRALPRLDYIRARARDAVGVKLSRFLAILADEKRIELPVGAVGESVELMSIHQAKGLEFPVVILGGLGHRFNLEDIRKNVLFDRELGFGTKVMHSVNPVRYPTAAFGVVKRRMQTRQLEEEMRKLYVAMTRAKERLIIVGTIKESAVTGRYEERRGDGAMPILERESASCFADWLVPVALESQAFQGALRRAGAPPRTAPRGFGANLGAECVTAPVIEAYFDEHAAKREAPSKSNETNAAAAIPAQSDADSIMPTLIIPPAVTHQYEFCDATRVRAKVSATALAHMDDPDSLSVRFSRLEPSFRLPEKPSSIAERLANRGDADDAPPAIKRGIAVHKLMERMPLGAGAVPDVAAKIAKLVACDALTAEQARLIPVDSLKRILGTPVGRRLCGRGRVLTEWRFLSRMDAVKLNESPRILRALGVGDGDDGDNGRLTIQAASDDFIVLQGVVDLIFEDADGRIIVDWKTNNIAETEVSACAESYALQLWAYRHAVETAIGAVDCAYLAFVTPGVFVDLSRIE